LDFSSLLTPSSRAQAQLGSGDRKRRQAARTARHRDKNNSFTNGRKALKSPADGTGVKLLASRLYNNHKARPPTLFLFFRDSRDGATLLQLYNAAWLGAFWPFFTRIVVQPIAAMFQFARMILVRSE
jgi:hypothetical protein